mgnify:CR=1 FL=1
MLSILLAGILLSPCSPCERVDGLVSIKINSQLYGPSYTLAAVVDGLRSRGTYSQWPNATYSFKYDGGFGYWLDLYVEGEHVHTTWVGHYSVVRDVYQKALRDGVYNVRFVDAAKSLTHERVINTDTAVNMPWIGAGVAL